MWCVSCFKVRAEGGGANLANTWRMSLLEREGACVEIWKQQELELGSPEKRA